MVVVVVVVVSVVVVVAVVAAGEAEPPPIAANAAPPPAASPTAAAVTTRILGVVIGYLLSVFPGSHHCDLKRRLENAESPPRGRRSQTLRGPNSGSVGYRRSRTACVPSLYAKRPRKRPAVDKSFRVRNGTSYRTTYRF